MSIIVWLEKSLDIFVQLLLFYVKYTVQNFQRKVKAESFRLMQMFRSVAIPYSIVIVMDYVPVQLSYNILQF